MRRTAAWRYPPQENPEDGGDTQPMLLAETVALINFWVSLLSQTGHTTVSSLLKMSFSKTCSQTLH
jgi:hypothetical protein